MKHTRKMQRLLEKMAEIERMERGKICPMGGRPHYNHQAWQNGRNTVRYVPAEEKDFVQEAINGYAEFKRLAEAYVDEVIARTRQEQSREFPKPKSTRKRQGPVK